MKKERTARPKNEESEMPEEYDFTADDFRNAVRASTPSGTRAEPT